MINNKTQTDQGHTSSQQYTRPADLSRKGGKKASYSLYPHHITTEISLNIVYIFTKIDDLRFIDAKQKNYSKIV